MVMKEITVGVSIVCIILGLLTGLFFLGVLGMMGLFAACGINDKIKDSLTDTDTEDTENRPML